jgi:5-methylcytosine-specific restriction endonuclease McrA
MIFKIDETKTQNNEIEESINKSEPLSLFEQLEKQKNDIELRMKEEIKKQEEERLKQEEEKRKIEEEEKRNLEAEEKRKIEEEKKENKKKKQSIPKNVRIIIWNHYIGEDIIKHKCLCCKKVTISNTNFEVGHVLSEKNGGTHEINNLRPICFSCNHSMGPENMVDFVVKYGLYIG